MSDDRAGDLEERISLWREFVRRRRAIHDVDVEELEGHLRDQIESLGDAGLSADEAFLVAVKRLGELDVLSREFALEYSERLWKQLVLAPDEPGGEDAQARDAWVALGLAVLAAIAIKLPAILGRPFEAGAAASFYLRHSSLFVLPPLAAYFAWKRRLGGGAVLRLAAPFVVAAILVNLYPFVPGGHTEILAAIHLPIALWLVVGFAYAGGAWRNHDRRMDFIRFSGEWFIYYVLIALGGGVLMMFTMVMFKAIGIDAEWVLEDWLIPCGASGAVVVSAWLVEAKQSVVENMAPVLTKLFTPLFTGLLILFLATMAWTGRLIDTEREVLIAFDLLLVLVLGLVLYAISARDPAARPGAFDGLQLALVLCALVVDALALAAIAGRISEFGFSPNKVAALGENLVLLANLSRAAALYARFLRGHAAFDALERWQTAYLPVYAIWAACVAVIFPPLFGWI